MSGVNWLRSFGRGIAWRLLVAIVLFSSGVTLVLTVSQLYLDYRTEVGDIHDRLEEIHHSYLGSIGASLWSLDVEQIQLQLEGIRHLPDIQFLEVRELGRPFARQTVVTVGERTAERVIRRDYPITVNQTRDKVEDVTIGVLHVEASLSGVYVRLAERAVAILVSQGVKTFLVSAFTMFIFHHLVTRHLMAMGMFLRSYRLGMLSAPVKLARKPAEHPDELDELVASLNAMSSSLAASVDEREQTLRRLRQQEAALDRAYRHFTTQETAAKLAHELKQPLACVSTYVQGLQAQMATGQADPGELPGLLDRIGREVSRVREIIAASQSRTEGPIETRELVGLGEVMADVAPLLRQIADDARAATEMDFPDPGPRVQGSRASLQQVAVNLVRNACEAMAGQPPFTRRLYLSVDEKDGWARFCVRDSGTGFPEQVVKTGHALFASTKRMGSGFGLPIANAIMQSHGGRLEIGNDEPGGARVTCWLPKASGDLNG